jgi:hypothetical protein
LGIANWLVVGNISLYQQIDFITNCCYSPNAVVNDGFDKFSHFITVLLQVNELLEEISYVFFVEVVFEIQKLVFTTFEGVYFSVDSSPFAWNAVQMLDAD